MRNETDGETMNRATFSQRRSMILCSLVMLGLLGYVQPWILAPSGSMTLNAFDLAEWTSLHPAQRATSPPLLTPLLLRLQLLLLSVILSANAPAGRMKVAAAAIAILVLTAAQMPPLEFVYDFNNLNYRQQFYLAGASLVASFALLAFSARRISTLATVALPLIGIVTAALGLAQAMELYDHYALDAAPGAGIWVLSLSYVGMIVVALVYKMGMRR
ncbi:MAG: hypothetical protein OXN88_12800 [Chloroflexota bacterium]|nr:hypothetical protein [Chloroflexota bacterium]